MQRKYRNMIQLALVLIVTVGIALWAMQFVPRSSPDLIEVEFKPEFQLTDQDNAARSAADYADRYMLIYFGFTYCPDICPLVMQRMAEAKAALPESKRNKLQLLLISVDPDRDTPKVLKNYTGLFGGGIVGLTGKQSAIDAAEKNFKVYSKKNGEALDHTSLLYLVGPKGKPIGVFKSELPAADLAKNLDLTL